jgi:nucleoside-diphosphate-sugar epimerase
VNEALRLYAPLAGRPLDVRCVERERGDVWDTGADITRAADELGYRPRTSIDEGLEAEFEWMLELERRPSRAGRHAVAS